jgi:hypothetical protein
MQQFITSAEALALLDRVLQTSQSLSAAIDRFVRPIAAAPIQPVIVEEPTVLPEPPCPVAPVLTIKLADLMRESAAYQRRHPTPKPKPQRTRPVIRNLTKTQRDAEVLYRRSFRMVS